jgi:uncharacterized membrane protein
MSVATIDSAHPGIALRAGLWIAQVLVFLAFGFIGATKLFTPLPKLAEIIPWAAQYSAAFVRSVGVIDLAGALGILLPALTRIKPGLTVAAALGCTVLQICAIVFHLSRGEGMVTPLNFVLLALSAFVLWGRARKARIQPRS